MIDIKKSKAFIKSSTKDMDVYLKTIVPGRIIAMRKGLGLSQVDISEIFEMQRANWNKFEKGRNTITLRQAINLSLLFNCTIDYLVKPENLQGLSRVEQLLQDQVKSKDEMIEMLKQKIKELGG